MSLALKFTSLAIRTFSKPIANYIKRQAREHPGFKQTCVSFAQTLHRVDMRWRIGLLQDAAVLEKQAAREAAKREAEKRKAEIPTVKTEAQAKAEEAQATKEKTSEEKEKHPPKPKIKPLSETKAIETGANFISETFLFGVAASLIIFESWRSGRKERNRRDRVAEQLGDLEEENKAARQALIQLEREVLRLRAKEKGITNAEIAKSYKILPAEVYEMVKEDKDDENEIEKPKGWLSNITSVFSKDEPDKEAKEALATNSPGPAEKLLKQADEALEKKRKLREAEQAEAAGSSKAPKKT
ncbi:hypothetical protein PMZ80_007132 [Knufia obscura]|uniref:OPA3-like protein n=1 Tax=Knufia obscura TaxID=1635080 RepID=A0ABR0RK76_9EURO|nr:hypothetical protein PMZ80_007132 [Knufia obscura]